MPDTEPSLLMCVRAGNPNVVSGSTEAVCADCGRPIMVSPSGQAMADRQPMRMVCLKCGLAETPPHAPIFQPPGTREAVAKALGEDAARRLPPEGTPLSEMDIERLGIEELGDG